MVGVSTFGLDLDCMHQERTSAIEDVRSLGQKSEVVHL